MFKSSINNTDLVNYGPTTAYVGASWAVLGVGVISFLIGLWNATGMVLSEKGYYVAVIALGLYAAISLQKTIRDKAEGIPTSMLYYWISWSALGLAIGLVILGLFNASGLSLSEKGFYMMSFTMSLFAAITIQKNTRDEAQIRALQITSQTSKPSPKLVNETNVDGEGSLFNSLRSKRNTEDKKSV